MILERVVVGPMETNCYILGDEKTQEAVVVDPGDDYPKIKRCLDKYKLTAKVIINTHGHIDHIGANDYFNLPIYIHTLDKDYLMDPQRNLSFFFSSSTSFKSKVYPLEDKDIVGIDRIKLRVIHTPGHTPGGISLILDEGGNHKSIFTGDTLFSGGVGRTDFPYASESELFKSIKERLLVFSDDTNIYPGHGPFSTLGEEKRNNPFLC